MGRVFRYAYVQAKARAMKGKLLSPEDWRCLLRMKGRDDILRYLSGTDYAGALSRLPETGAEARAIVLAFHDALFHDYARLIRAVSARDASLLKAFLLFYDAENLKVMLRGVWKRRPPSQIRSLLYRLGRLSLLPVEALLEAREIAAALELLKGTPFRLPLAHALPQVQARGKLLPLETAVDRAVFAAIAATLDGLRGTNRKGAELLVGAAVDAVNLEWLVRFRHFYGLSPEQAINMTVPGGRRLGLKELGAAARAGDLASFLAALPSPYRNVLGGARQWTHFRPLLRRWLLGELLGVFSKDPFQVSLPLSTLLLKEMEVKALESLLSAVEVGEPLETLVDRVGLPGEGGVRV